MGTSQQQQFFTADLPDALLYNILTYVSVPTKIAVCVIHSLLPLCSTIKDYFDKEDALWELILGGYYYESDGTPNRTDYQSRRQRRDSKRLRRTTAKYDVAHAHLVLRDRTDMALQDVADLAISKSPPLLSVSRLRGILHTYGPHLNINQQQSTSTTGGGTFLVDCCRARHVTERVILKCIEELIVRQGASPHVPAMEAAGTHGKVSVLPALVVASARGMPLVVQYLLDCPGSDESIHVKGTSRFRLFTKPRKSVNGTFTPLEFALQMKKAEMEYGATPQDLKSLNKCIDLLQQREGQCNE